MALFIAPLLADYLVLMGVAVGVSITAGLFVRYTILPSTPAEALEEDSIFERVIPCDCDCKCDGMPAPTPDEPSSDEEEGNSTISSEISSFHDSGHASPSAAEQQREPHSLETSLKLLSEGRASELRNGNIVQLVSAGKLPLHALERVVGDAARAVRIRRAVLSLILLEQQQDDGYYRSHRALSGLPHRNYDFDAVAGRCAENVIGYVPVPVGVAGPLAVDGRRVMVPMATTEGALVASTSRGAKALNHARGGLGVQTELADDGMTRAPVLGFPSLRTAAQAKRFLDSPPGQALLADAFDASSRFGRLVHATSTIVGSRLYVRFKARTGEAMGMNMVGKGVALALDRLRGAAAAQQCPALAEMHVLSLSGNVCADKKAAAVNWIHGRGKSVCAEAVVPADAVRRVLKCEVAALVHVSTHKNLVGSAVAGSSVGGFNAQAANIVAAVFLATGQDIAQVVASSNCLTLMEETPSGDLKASVTMPSLEVGTVGGGTGLAPQSAMLELIGARGADRADGSNAAQLAKTIAAAVLAGELSLCSALVTQDLIQSHMALNRK
ncbi:hydroxymethylglutaryl-CoA reductase [Neofusicoccum parvum]|uniref:Hydroxymethylglutaryl-CoA reductase, partial n=2 Tax=Neofusicoccum parvum TaxID=310453 RepID=A0ACB5SAE9_9PEZI|nr:hydroxymethylglutaryl-CoA reductase [Neofusicoccum parvum]